MLLVLESAPKVLGSSSSSIGCDVNVGVNVHSRDVVACSHSFEASSLIRRFVPVSVVRNCVV
jgi:hypothetical protein